MKTRYIESIQFFLDGTVSFCRNDENDPKLIYNDYESNNQNRILKLLLTILRDFGGDLEIFDDSVCIVF